MYAFEVLTYGQPVFGPTNPAWDAAIVVTSPQFPGLSTRLFGLNIVP